MSTIYLIIILLITISILESGAFTYLKKYHDVKKINFFIYSIILYAVILYILSYLFNFGEIAIVNALWNAFSMVLITIAGYIFFKEKLTKNEIVALILIILGTIMIAVDNK